MSWKEELLKIPLEERTWFSRASWTRPIWNGSRPWEEKDLLNHWIKFFTELDNFGFKIKIIQKTIYAHTSWIGKASKAGISIRIDSYNYINAGVYVVNNRGGYEHRINIDITNDKIVEKIYNQFKLIPSSDQIKRRKPVTLESLPEPFKFEQETIQDENGFIKLVAEIHSVKVEKMVTIEQNGRISDKHLANPNENIWYHLSCAGNLGATFDIISDGEIFHPIVRYGNKRVTTVTIPKASVNLTKCSKLDQQLVQLAIKKFMEKL